MNSSDFFYVTFIFLERSTNFCLIFLELFLWLRYTKMCNKCCYQAKNAILEQQNSTKRTKKRFFFDNCTAHIHGQMAWIALFCFLFFSIYSIHRRLHFDFQRFSFSTKNLQSVSSQKENIKTKYAVHIVLFSTLT